MIEELKRIQSILSCATGLEDDDQEYIEDARKAIDALIEQQWPERLEELQDIFKDVDQCGPLLGMGREQQPADEPVAKYIAEGSEGSLVQLYEDVKIGTNFYTRPQPAAWVGLTDDELADCVPDEAQVIERDGERNRVAMTRQQLHEFVANAAKLREKNKQQGEQA